MSKTKEEFAADKTLLNPFFESYKLESSVLHIHELAKFDNAAAPIGRVLSGADTDVRLGWKEARSRANWQHLAVSKDEQEIAWIDAEAVVWHCRWEAASEYEIKQLIALPKPVGTSQQSKSYLYPAIISLGQSIYLVSDGAGRLYVVKDGSKAAEAEFMQDGRLQPFRLHAAYLKQDQIEAVISYDTFSASTRETEYRVSAVSLLLTSPETVHLSPSWTLTGSNIPSYVAQHEEQWMIGASCAYISSKPTTKAVLTPPSVNQSVAEAEQSNHAGYTWTQDSLCLTISFNLPSSVTKEHIKVSFSPRNLSVLIETPSDISPSDQIPSRISHRQLYAPIDPSSSTWTFDAAEHTLTINLEKPGDEDGGPRWSSLFSDQQAGDPEESFTAEHLENMRDVLSHMTQEEGQETTYKSTSGLLGEEEDELEMDTSLSEAMSTFTYVDKDGSIETSQPVEMLSSSLPSSSSCQSIVIKKAYDGLLFNPKWIHQSSYPALSYVLASKRSLNMRFILHHQEKFCIAIESGGNVWAYFPPPPGKKSKTAKQAVARLDDDLGAVLGCGAIEGIGVLLLSEKGLSVVSGLL